MFELLTDRVDGVLVLAVGRVRTCLLAMLGSSSAVDPSRCPPRWSAMAMTSGRHAGLTPIP